MEILVDGSPRACKQSRSSLLVASQKPGRGGRGTRGCPRLTTSARRTPLEFRCWNTTETACWFRRATGGQSAMHATPPAHPGTVETCEPRRQILYYGRTTSVLQSDEFGLNLPRRRILYYGRAASVLRSGEFGLNLPQRLILHCGRTTSVLQSADFGLGVRCRTAGVFCTTERRVRSQPAPALPWLA